MLNGITTAAPIASLFYREWGETVAEFTAAAEAAGELGLRVYLSPAYRAGGRVLEAPDRMEPMFDEARGLSMPAQRLPLRRICGMRQRWVARAQADIAVFGLDDAIMTPAIDPITTLVAGGSGKVTRAEFVGGRLSMRAGKVAGMVMVAAQAQFDGLSAKYPERSWNHPAVAALFPPS